MKSIMMTSIIFGLLSLANANSLELNYHFNGNRIHDLSKHSEPDKAQLFKRDQMIAWNKPIAMFMDMPNIDETMKTGHIIRNMRPLKIGDRVIQCRASGKVSKDDMAHKAHPKAETERIVQFYKVRVLRVVSAKRTAVSFSIFDDLGIQDDKDKDEDYRPDNKRLTCAFQTEKNGQPININMETPITVEEIKEYITLNNRIQLTEQANSIEAVKKIREAYRKQQLEDKAAQKKLDEIPLTEIEKLFGRINPSKNNNSALAHSLFEDNIRTHIVEAYRFPRSLSEIEASEEEEAKAPAPAAPANESKAQSEGPGF